ncbi:hypothetical protein GCM10017044_18520 [Kordiimonas sediminis]|uniref:DJ-1/PfpI domain-containing protein n=1 Tax=Kordiimonas sediminis TaxID=1735581 RepID=A0A919ARZ1_9PROT|nr:type 1 glutamine amidotransferase domain-containing protein [Kordiimonas sediminis]GHF24201.1 hypothetical protein GCM10017044_18520 [Kordiimonas sediminis]
MNGLFKRVKFAAAALLAVTVAAPTTAADQAKDNKSVLMVISSHGKDGGETAPGYEFDEFSAAFLVFQENGLTIDVASPKGGKAEADKFDPKAPLNAKVLEDEAIMAKLDNSLPLADINPDAYEAIFIVGGKGAMFDFHNDTNLQNIIRDIYVDGGTVSAVCHGPAAFVNVTLPDGTHLLAGKKVNGFTNVEEKLFGKKWAKEFEFLLEDELMKRGGLFQSSPMMLSHVAEDGRLITGQNPTSTVHVAEAVVRSLGIEPVDRVKETDEVTLALVQNIMDNGISAASAYTEDKSKFNGQLISMYGYYYSMVAEKDEDITLAIDIMSLETDVSAHPTLRLQMAQSWLKLGEKKMALSVANSILDTNPDHEGASRFIQSLNAE